MELFRNSPGEREGFFFGRLVGGLKVQSTGDGKSFFEESLDKETRTKSTDRLTDWLTER